MKIIITAGGTSERIDNVRKITNEATGRLGSLIADELCARSGGELEKIYYVCEKTAILPQAACVEVVTTSGVEQVCDAFSTLLSSQRIDAVIHSMAVSDYTLRAAASADDLADAIAQQLANLNDGDAKGAILRGIRQAGGKLAAQGKISSQIDDLVLLMRRTPKVIHSIKKIQPSTILVGFKLLDHVPLETLLTAGRRVMEENDCDFVLANDTQDMVGGGHVGYLLSRGAGYERLDGKQAIAQGIVTAILQKKESASQ